MSKPEILEKRFYLHSGQGNLGKTYIYKTKTDEIFFVKDTHQARHYLKSSAKRLIAQQEYVTLVVMSLLGLKVPTEIALIENEKNELFLIKRKVADREQNKAITEPSEAAIDEDWSTSRNFVIKMLNIGDLSIYSPEQATNNARIKYLNEDGKKLDRYIDHDPLIITEADPDAKRKEVFIEWQRKIRLFPEFSAALGKTKSYFEKNKDRIFATTNIIQDEHERLFFQENLENLARVLKDLPGQDLDSSKLYIARKVAPALDFNDLLAEMEKETGEKFNMKEGGVHYYSVTENFKSTKEFKENEQSSTPSTSLESASHSRPATSQLTYKGL